MSILRNIRLDDGRRFYLCDDTAENDDRTVEDEDARVYLVFDSSCNVRKPDGTRLAGIHSRERRYVMEYQGQAHDLGPGSWETSWKDLESAEVEAAKILLPLV